MPRKPAVGGDAAKRGARTGAQLALPILFVQGFNLFAPHPMTSEQASWAIGVGTLLIGFCQNVLEEQGVIPGLLKGPTPIPPTDDLTRRELNALATAIGGLHDQVLDLRADKQARQEPAIFTEQTHSPARRRSDPVPEEVPFKG